MSRVIYFHRLILSIGLALIYTPDGLLARELSLADAMRRADAENPALLAQGYAGRAAGALIEQAGVRPNPMLDVALENFAGTGALRGVDGVETTVQVSQTLERGDKREKRVIMARREHEVADREFTVRRTEVLVATAIAYIEVLAAQERLALSTDSLALTHKITDAVALRVRGAAASAAESARARVALASAHAEHTRAEAGLAQARVTLATMWGGTPADVAIVAGTLSVPPPELPVQQALLEKLATHPRLELQQAIIASRRAALQLQQAQAAQNITVGGGVRFLREGSDTAFVAGVSVPIPFHNANQGNIRAAREILTGAEQSVRAIEAELRTAFAAAWQDLQVARSVARDLRGDALPATEEALAVVRHAYNQGELPLLEVLDAQRAHTALRREILEAETSCATALVRVEALTDTTFPLTTAVLSSR